jgi:hypothetical protein
MHLRILKQGKHWSIKVMDEVRDGGTVCHVEQELDALEQGELLTLDRVLTNLEYGLDQPGGPRMLGTKRYHEAHTAKLVGELVTFYEFKQGKCRVYFFHEGNAAIAVHAVKKKGNETAKDCKTTMEAAYLRYAAANKAKKLKS